MAGNMKVLLRFWEF